MDSKTAARLERDPKTRASVPTNLLSARYRRLRMMNSRLDRPVAEGSSVTERDVARSARADAGARYGEADRQAQVDLEATRLRRGSQEGYLRDYRAALAAARERTKAEQAQVVQPGVPDAAAQQVSAGTTEDGARAAAVRGALSGSTKDVLAAGYDGRLARLEAAMTAGVQAMRTEADARLGGEEASARGRLVNLRRDRADYESGLRDKGRDAARQSALERIALGIKESDSVRDAERAAADRAARARENQRDRDARAEQARADRESREQIAANRANGRERGSGKPRAEPKTSLERRNLILGRARTIQQLASQNNLTTRDAFKEATMQSRGGWYTADQQLATGAALDLHFKGRISRGYLKELRKLGIFVTADGSYWGGGNRGG